MAESLGFSDSQINLDEISKELCAIDSQLNKNQMPDEKSKSKTNELGVIGYQMKLNNNTSKNLITVMEYLKFYFGHPNFKNEVQKNAIDSILKREYDVIVSMPMGNGRSLCYQLPAIMQWPKVTIVFCSMIHRIMNQVRYLKSLNIDAEHLTAETTANDQKRIVAQLCFQNIPNHTCILYVTPDRAFIDDFHKILHSLLEKNRLAYIVLDEAYCESEWCYGPKNEYRILGILRKMYIDIPWIVVTAEAGLDIIDFIRITLLLKNAASGSLIRFQASTFRPNVFYDVVLDEVNGNSYVHLKIFLDLCLPKTEEYIKGDQPCGLIFCKTQSAANKLAMSLRLKGSLITTYHAGLTEHEKINTEILFMRGNIQVLAVTGSYGMRLHHKNVSVVVHWGLPSSLSKFFDESGQAGRNGKPARSRIYLTESSTKYYNKKNQRSLALEMDNASTSIKMQNATKSFLMFLQSRFMIDFCLYHKCRNLILAEYFGDPKPLCENNCDICLLKIDSSLQDFERSPNLYSMENLINKIFMKFIKLEKTDRHIPDLSNILNQCKELLRNNNFKAAGSLYKFYDKRLMKIKKVYKSPFSTLSIKEEENEDSLQSSSKSN